jgi:SAM-dependent methyltransferase
MDIFAYGNYHTVHYANVEDERYERSLSVLEQHVPDARSVLDVGCGSGAFLRAARRRGYECAGIEYEAEAISRAQALSGVPVTTLQAAIDHGSQYDVVRLGHVVVVMPDPRPFVRSLEPLMAHGGKLVVETAIENNPSIAYWSTSAAKWVRRRFGRDAPASKAPTIVWRTDGATMRTFFTREFGYRLAHQELFDDGWPLWESGQPATALRERARRALARLAVRVSVRQGAVGRRLGNQTIMVLDPSPSGAPSRA